MSTRATYQFIDKRKYAATSKPITVYIHYDGYPEGAASYFYNMLCDTEVSNGYASWRGCLATRFIRANPLAEITESHEAHGDTEWRYSLVLHDDSIVVGARRRPFNDEWALHFRGSIADFVNSNSSQLPEGAFVASNNQTDKNLKAIISNCREWLGEYLGGGGSFENCNVGIYQKKISDAQELLEAQL
jgi:hypothetical protein